MKEKQAVTNAPPVTDGEQRALYLEDLLRRQVERLRKYDIDGAMKIANEAQPLANGLARDRLLERPEMADSRRRIQGLYQELCLTIAAERQEVSDKLQQIRQGLKALGGYAGK